MNAKAVKTIFVGCLCFLFILVLAHSETSISLANSTKSLSEVTSANPSFVIFPEWEWYDGNNWPDGEVTITVNKDGCNTSGVSSNGFFNGSFPEGCNIVSGDVITFSQDDITLTHTVQVLTISEANGELDTVMGAASNGAIVDVWPWKIGPGQSLQVTANPDGTWLANFNGSVDLVPDDCGRAQIYDSEGNGTAVDWCVPRPTWVFFPEQKLVELSRWKSGSEVTATIDTKPECIATGTPTNPDWEPRFLNPYQLRFPEDCEITTADFLNVTNGDTTLPGLVSYLQVTAVDENADTVTGKAGIGSPVHIWLHAGCSNDIWPTVAEDHTWTANFGEVGCDLGGGMSGRVQVDMGDTATAVDWRVPYPYIDVRTNADQISTWDWPLGELTLKIYESGSEVGEPNFVATGEVTGPPEGDSRNYYNFDLSSAGYNVQPGYLVVISHESLTKSILVSPLAFDVMDIQADTVSGHAWPDGEVNVWACDNTSCYIRYVTADNEGVWLADWSVEGPREDEKNTFDLTYGTWVDSRQTDEDGDNTVYGVNFPIPFIEASPNGNWIHARGWPNGTLVTLTIDNPDNGEGIDYTQSTSMGPAPWNPGDSNDIVGAFQWPVEITPGSGDILTITGIVEGYTYIRTLVVADLRVTSADPSTGIVAGIASPGSTSVEVCLNRPDTCISNYPAVDGAGNWSLDYSAENLQSANNGWAREFDDDGDYTWLDWSVPWLIAFPENDAVEGWDWPQGATVYLSINNDPHWLWMGIADVTTWGDPRTYVNFDISGDYNLQAGDQVILSSDYGRITHTVQALEVTDVDRVADTISGKADPGATVQLWPHGYDQTAFIEATAGEDRTWLANFSGVFDLIYGTAGRAQISIDGNNTAVDWGAPISYWRDEFNGTLAEGWTWVNENDTKWSLEEQLGWLRIYTSPGRTGEENLLLRPVNTPDFMIKTHLYFEPGSNFQIAGLVLWQDPEHYLQLGRAFCDAEGCAGNAIYFDKIDDGNLVDGNFATQVDSPNDAYLRLEKRGNMVKAFFSYDNFRWFEIGTHWIDFEVSAVGLTASQDQNGSSIPADFEFFDLAEDWGFLPEGFHDYDTGDVPHWACNAGGWAADPDDRLTDLSIDIFADNTFVTNLTAGDFRQDLQDAGVCLQGNCSFSTSLWGAISSYEPHSIEIWAKDALSDEWVRLSSSPKPLTCRTYDIYAYDPLKGTTRQVSDLRNADEYFPSWSPNGKQVAYHVVFLDGSYGGIFITDLKSGQTAQLQGAEDGGAPAWSPNGRWIAFNRQDGIYLLPASGGTPVLVRNDAQNADWAPNGKRLVFSQPSDGSIRTMAIDGGPGGETMVVENGEMPVWSPDGKWIAYGLDGHIWKIKVNNLGVPQGDPIQLTSGAFQDGQPTWSPDSLSIVYHSGFANGDWDLWSVSATGGMGTWLTGGVVFGDYDPAYAKDQALVGYASFTPEGQAERDWVSVYTYDLPQGTWSVAGDYTFQFLWEDNQTGATGNEAERTFSVLEGAPLYDGYALIRPWNTWALNGEEIVAIDAINPEQDTRFHIGYNYHGTYLEAVNFFNNFNVTATWTGPSSGTTPYFTRHEILPYTNLDWWGYVCTYVR